MRLRLIFSLFFLLTLARANEPNATRTQGWSYDSLHGQNQNQAQPTEEQQIAALLALMVDRWNAHDIEGYMDALWHSPDLLCVFEGEEFMGWDNLRASYLRGYPNRTAMGSVFVERTRIQLISADVATAMDWWKASFGPNTHSVYATSTYLLRKFPEEGWKVVVFHTSFVEP